MSLLLYSSFLFSENNINEKIRLTKDEKRDFYSLTLENGMKVLFVIDPEAPKAGLSVDVRVGHYDNPNNFPGLLHLLEHTISKGSKNYPGAIDFSEFINKSMGDYNATINAMNTNYHMQFSHETLEGVIQRVADFLTFPLYTESVIAKEIDIIHSEYTLKRKTNYWKKYHLLQSMINQNHPASKFRLGNKTTLPQEQSSQIRQALLALHKEHYVGSNMTLAIISREPPELVIPWIKHAFSQIPTANRINLEKYSSTSPFSTTDQIVNMIPNEGYQSIIFYFPVHETLAAFKNKVLLIVRELLHAEGDGSVYKALKKRNWSSFIAAQTFFTGHQWHVLELEIQLTSLGLKNRDAIIAQVLAYIKALSKDAKIQSLYQEQIYMNQLAFEYRDTLEAWDETLEIAQNLQFYPFNMALDAQYRIEAIDIHSVQNLLKTLNHDNMLVFVLSDAHQTPFVEPYSKTPYNTEKITNNLLKIWDNTQFLVNYHAPYPNEFVPNSITVTNKNAYQNSVEKIFANKNIHVWLGPNDEAQNIKAVSYLQIESPAINAEPQSALMTEMLVMMLREQMAETRDKARLGKLFSHLATTRATGIQIKLFGYADKQLMLLKEFMQTLYSMQNHLDLNNKKFKTLKEEIKKALMAHRNNSQLEQHDDYFNHLMTNSHWTDKVLLDELKDINKQVFLDFVTDYFQCQKIQALFYGSLTEQALKSYFSKFVFPGPNGCKQHAAKKGYVDFEKHYFNQNLDLDIPIAHEDRAVSFRLLEPNDTLETTTKLFVLSEILKKDFYETMRNQKNMGYHIATRMIDIGHKKGIRLFIQSSAYASDILHITIQNFVKNYPVMLSKLGDLEFEQLKHNVLVKISVQTLEEKTDIAWYQITSNPLHLKFNTTMEKEIRSLTKKEFIDYAKKLLDKNSIKSMSLTSKVSES
ncbi:MAG: insulinase family protein [Pseudomonadota bacterium]